MKHGRAGYRAMLPIRRVVLGLSLVVLAGCGDDGSPTAAPTPTPPPTPPPPRTVLDRRNVSVRAGFAVGEFFTTDRAGTLEAVVDYTFATSTMVVWVARGQCTADQFGANQCDYAASSFVGAKPRRVSVTGAAAGTYTLIVGNGASQDESISYQVVLTPSAAAAANAGAGARAEGSYVVRLPR